MATGDSQNACAGIMINGNASYGNDPQPLFEAGQKNMACVIEIEALAQLQLSHTVIDQHFENKKVATWGGLTIKDPIYKYNVTASSGQAYYVETMIAMGRRDVATVA
jgi:hypothetical protein